MKKALLIGAAVVAIGAGAALAHGPWRGHHGHGHGYYGGHHGGYEARGHRRGKAGRMLEQRFDQFDADGDGLVTREELAAARSERFSAMDADGDGAVTAEELVQFRMLRRAQRRIERMDQNGDGVLQETELRMGARMFDRFDLNADGAVSRAEIDIARDAMRGKRGWGRRDGERRWGRGPEPIDEVEPDAAPAPEAEPAE